MASYTVAQTQWSRKWHYVEVFRHHPAGWLDLQSSDYPTEEEATAAFNEAVRVLRAEGHDVTERRYNYPAE